MEVTLTKEFLKEEYEIKERTYDDIGRSLGCSKHKVMYWANKFGLISRRGGRKAENLKGRKNGDMEVLRIHECEAKYSYWVCRCGCGIEFVVTSSAILGGQERCKKCRDEMFREIGLNNWKGHGEISGEFWGRVQKCAKLRDYDFSILIEEAWDLFLIQNKKCALSGVNLVFSRNCLEETTASLDRIDSNKHYVLNNVQWVHKDLQRMKWDMDESHFILCCRLIADFRDPNRQLNT
jgi:hypothetical protein